MQAALRFSTSRCTTTVVCCPCGRRATSASHPASTRLMNASTAFGNGGTCTEGPSGFSPCRRTAVHLVDIGVALRVAVVTFPLRDQRVPMRIQRGVELRGLQLRQRDPIRRVGLADGLA